MGRSVDPILAFYVELGKDVFKMAPAKQEDAAKQLIQITTLLQAIYFAAISFSDLKKALLAQGLQGVQLAAVVLLFAFPVILWLVSLYFSIRVIVPITGKYNLSNPMQVKHTYQASIKYKQRNLWYAYVTLFLGFIPLILNIFIYLLFIPNII